MKGFTKKIVSVVLALTMVFAVATTAMAASWEPYFGKDSGWKEGGSGTLENNTATGFTAKITHLGWGGIWGIQAKNNAVKVNKGTAYAVTFKASSSKLNKFLYVKMAKDGTEKVSGAFWVLLKRGKNVNVNEVFVAKENSKLLTIGMGGEDFDRSGIDADADIRYGIFNKQYKGKFVAKAKCGLDADGLFDSAPTDIKVSNFKITPAAKKVSFKAKAKGKKKVQLKMKKAAGVYTYQIQVGKVKKKTTKATYTVKAKKKGKQTVKVRGISQNKAYTTKWTSKKVKVK